VGATISHPHGQIYAYDHVPDRPRRLFASDWRPDSHASDRRVVANSYWVCDVPFASEFPLALSIAPTAHVSDLPSLDDRQRNDLAAMLVDVFDRLDRLFDEPLPYMMWINQRPFDGTLRDSWLSIDIVSPWRQRQLPRFIAAAEIGAGEFFNPVIPEDVAARLRDLSC
jgi:UDPglucose--hexose-1-phosphate uridylyltransferase